jgi:hypothetical protein
MKQYRITAEHINQDSSDDAFLAPEDPIHELKVVQYLAGLGSEARLMEYRATQNPINTSENISATGSEKRRIERENNIQPGTPEWFKLWFSLPYLTGEKSHESK